MTVKNWNHGIPKTMIVSEAISEIERLRRLIAWCRPRLSKDVYRYSLDDQLIKPRKDDGSTVTNNKETGEKKDAGNG